MPTSAPAVTPRAKVDTIAILDREERHPVRDQLRELHLLERLTRLEETAAAGLFPASDEACFATGSPLVAGGGFAAGRRVALD